MSFVAVAWLAIELAPQATAGLWVGGAVAAYTLPGVVGALRQLPLWPVTVVIVVAWGLALLPFGFDVPTGRLPLRASRSAARSTDRS